MTTSCGHDHFSPLRNNQAWQESRMMYLIYIEITWNLIFSGHLVFMLNMPSITMTMLSVFSIYVPPPLKKPAKHNFTKKTSKSWIYLIKCFNIMGVKIIFTSNLTDLCTYTHTIYFFFLIAFTVMWLQIFGGKISVSLCIFFGIMGKLGAIFCINKGCFYTVRDQLKY